MTTLGIITGFNAEARLLAGTGWRVGMAGGRHERACELARDMVKEGCVALVSFGIAGGLEPGLAPGTLVIGDGVWSTGDFHPCDPSWISKLQAALPGARMGRVAASPTVITSPEDKRALHQASGGAMAVDMESLGVAEIAAHAGVPFVILRALADPAERALPKAAAEGLDDQGNVRLGAVLWSLLRDPSQLPGLIRVGLDTNAALSALKAAVGKLA